MSTCSSSFWATMLTLLTGLLACSASSTPASAPAPASTPTAAEAVSSSAPPAEADAQPVAAPAAPSATTGAQPDASLEGASAAQSPTAEPVPPATGRSVPPAELLTAPRLAFMLDDPGSEIGQRLLEACQKKLPKADAEDPAKVAACRQAEREKFKADVFVFRKEGGNLRWIVYQRKGTTLSEVYSARVKLADEMASSFKIRAVSGQGVRPVFRARGDVPVEMPSRNEIVLEEPEYGRLVYRAKTGLVGN